MKRLPNVFEIKVNGIKVGGIEVNYKIIKERSIGHFRYNTKCLVHFGHYVFITNVIITK